MRNQYESEGWTLVHLTIQNKILFSVFNAEKIFTVKLNETKDNTFYVHIGTDKEITISHEPMNLDHSFAVIVEINKDTAIFNLTNQEQIIFKKV